MGDIQRSRRGGAPQHISDLFAKCDPLTQARAQVPPTQRKEEANINNSNPGPAETNPPPSAPDPVRPPKRELPKEVLGFCRSCHAPIYWCTLNGKKHPVDREITSDGTLALFLQTDDTVRATHIPKNQRAGKALRKSHFASCSQANQWRRR